MALKIKLESDIEKAIQRLGTFKNRTVAKLTRQTLNRTLKKGNTVASKEIRKERKISKAELDGSKKKGFRGLLSQRKAVGSVIDRMQATLSASTRTLGFIRFVPKGQRKKQLQRGISPKKRKKLSIEIKPGRKRKLPSAFIQRGGKNNTLQVFRRLSKKNNGKHTLLRQAVQSIAKLFNQPTIRTPVENTVSNFMSKEMKRLVDREVSK